MIIARAQHKALDLSTMFEWFIIYSYIGWLYETIYCSLDAGRFVNRGFMYGPFCPIYGSCILFMIILFSNRCKNNFTLFASCAIFASMLEYLVSFTMEAIFGRRWWNYSSQPFNINGRICLGAAIVFGVAGVLIIRYLHPKLTRYMNHNFHPNLLRKASILALAIFLIDLFVSIQMSLN